MSAPGGQPDPNNPLLAGWWDANDPASQTALETGVWPDRSQHGRDAIANANIQPIVEVSNGMSGVVFAQGLDFFNFPEIQLLSDPGTSASIFIVSSSFTADPLVGGPGFALANAPVGSPRIFGRIAGDQILFLGGGGSQNRFIDEQFFDRTQSINFIGLDGDNSGEITDLRINGNDLPQILSGGPLLAGAVPYAVSNIGAPGGGNWNGEISEVLIFQEKLTPAEEYQIASYLGGKYGVKVPEPSTSSLTLITLFTLALRRQK